MAKKEVFTTPKAKCRFPFLTIADTKFNPDGIYRIELIFDPAVKEHKEFLGYIKNLYVQSKGQNLPYKEEVDLETKEKTGKYIVKFTTNYRPKVFDAKGYHMDDDILVGNGSMVKVCYGYAFYEAMKGGVKLYLQAVQVLDLIEWNGGSFDDFGFQPEEGFSKDLDDGDIKVDSPVKDIPF